MPKFMVNDKPVFQWWVQDVCGAKPKRKGYYSSYDRNRPEPKVHGGDIAWAIFATLGAVLMTLLVLMFLLGAIIATKGILLFIIMLVGGLGYGIYKAILAVAEKD